MIIHPIDGVIAWCKPTSTSDWDEDMLKIISSYNYEDLFIFHSLESEIVSFVKTLDVSFSFNTISDDEKFFILTYYKLPLIIK